MIKLFDYVKLVFVANDKQWKEVSSMDKNRNFFMLNRFCSINQPIQASVLSHLKINTVAVTDYHWHKTFKKLYKTVPGWIYAKTIKKSAEDKKKNLPSEAMVKWFCQKNEMSRKDYDASANFFGNDFTNEIKDLEKILTSQGILKD